jgi:hypothetical protein
VCHSIAKRLRDALCLSTRDKRDARAGFNENVITTPALL